MMPCGLVDKVYAFTAQKGLFSAPCQVVLGLSGGADSMALLHILTHWPVDDLLVHAVHIHHGLRGKEADRDEMFVRKYCAEHGIPLSVIHGDVAALAQERRISIEEAGRIFRYEAFEQVRTQIGADYIVTAHTASDQSETVLMHIVRGCGVDGLCGIPAIRGCVRRPLLCCSRDEIEEYCQSYSIPYVTDETNADTKFVRNDFRLRILPALRELNPSIDKALLRLSDSAAEDSAYFSGLAADALSSAKQVYGYDANGFIAQSSVVRRRMIRQLFVQNHLTIYEESHILAVEKAILAQFGGVSLPGGMQLYVRQGIISIAPNSNMCEPLLCCLSELPCSLQFGRYILNVGVEDNVHNLFANFSVDYDKIVGRLCVRTRLADDYMHPHSRGVGKSLKKLMNEWHIPAFLRDSYPLLCDDMGVVLVPGYACDERVKITEDTKHYLVCKADDVQG